MEVGSLNEPILDAQMIAPMISKDLSLMSGIFNLMETEECIFEINTYVEILRNSVSRIQVLVEEIQLIEEENKELKMKIK